MPARALALAVLAAAVSSASVAAACLPGARCAPVPAVLMPAAPSPNLVARPRLDVTFVLDTTGSMGDEIDVVKAQLVSIARKLASGQPAPDARFAVVAYRDRGDEYLTRVLPFERDIRKVQRFINALQADGGGDEPEDVSAALHAALKLDWDMAPQVARVAFLVGDAGPQSYAGAPDWKRAATNLRERKISVHVIGCSGLVHEAEQTFRALAERTSGEFEHLTYSRVERLADGRKRTVLTTAGATYVADGELKASEWKRGAEKLAAEGRVRRDDSAGSAGGYAMATRMAAGGGGRALAAPTAGLEYAAKADAPVAASEMTNNLDAEIADRLVHAAKGAGAKY